MPFTVVNFAGDTVPVEVESCTTVGQLRKSIATSLGAHDLQLELMYKNDRLEDSALTDELEGPVTLVQAGFLKCILGHWANTDAGTYGMIGYSLAVSPCGQLRCAGYGKCHPSWSVSVFDATPTKDGFEMEADHCFKVETVVGKLHENGELIISASERFTDGSGRERQEETTYTMARIPGSLDTIEEHLTSTFYRPSGEPGMFDSDQRANMLNDFES